MAPSSGEEAMVDLLEQLQNFHPMMSKPFLNSNYLISIVRSQFSSRLKNKKTLNAFGLAGTVFTMVTEEVITNFVPH